MCFVSVENLRKVVVEALVPLCIPPPSHNKLRTVDNGPNTEAVNQGNVANYSNALLAREEGGASSGAICAFAG